MLHHLVIEATPELHHLVIEATPELHHLVIEATPELEYLHPDSARGGPSVSRKYSASFRTLALWNASRAA
jgi:hypothetical protein